MKFNRYDIGAGILLVGSMICRAVSREKKFDTMRDENKKILAKNAYRGGYRYQELLAEKNREAEEDEYEEVEDVEYEEYEDE